MGVKKWLMKQQWRVVQIRGIWGLFYGILLLAIAYYDYIPFFANMDTYGPFIFAGLILIGFLVLGYIYDRVLVMWAPSQEVNVERNPFQYVPAPKDKVFWFPVFSGLLDASEMLAKEFNINTDTIKETKRYYHKLQQLRPERNEDIEKGIRLRKDFLKSHSFLDILSENSENMEQDT